MLLVRASREDAVAALTAADLDGSVGPTAASGWTCVWLDDEHIENVEHLGFSTYLWAEENRSAALLVELKEPDTAPEQLTWWPAPDSGQLNGIVDKLVGQFGPAEVKVALRALLARDDLDLESFCEGLETHLDLPELAAPQPEQCVVATRGDRAMVRMAAAIAGPTWILPVESGWTFTIPTHEDDVPTEAPLAAAISAATKRRDRAVLLWSHGEAFGLHIWRGGSMDVSWSWGSGWESVVSDPLAFETTVTKAITPLNPDLHLPTLRALLRRPRLDDGAVASLLDLLGLPGSTAETLRASQAPERIPGAELVEKATPRAATTAAMRADWADRRRIRNRPLYLAYAIGTALAALVCLAMTVLGIAVLVTRGKLVDQEGVTAEDWLLVGVTAALTVVLIPTAIYRLRKFRKGDGPGDGTRG